MSAEPVARRRTHVPAEAGQGRRAGMLAMKDEQ
jgi:hypothetical protein